MGGQPSGLHSKPSRVSCNCRRRLSRRTQLCAAVTLIALGGFAFLFTHMPNTQNYQHVWRRFNGMSIDSWQSWVQNFKGKYQDSSQMVLSSEDYRLHAALVDRAKTRADRYYLNDFEYFRLIREEFPRTDSAAKLQSALSLTRLDPKDVLFIVMGSAKYVERARLLTETWLRWTRGNFFIFTETTNASIPMVSLPALENKTSREDAQHRQSLGAQWLMSNRSDLVEKVKWFMFVDDDTWVNVPALLSYLQFFDYRMSLSLGYLWDDVWVPQWAYFPGGGGVVFSQSAFVTTVPAIYSKECPYQGFNDVTWMRCQKKKGVTKIYSDRFCPYAVPLWGPSQLLMPVHYVGKITFHYMTNPSIVRRMTCDVAAYWRWPIEGCEAVKRENMSHLALNRPKPSA